MVTDSDIGKLTKRNMKRVSLIKIIPGLLIIVLINIIGTYLYFRLDLTAERSCLVMLTILSFSEYFFMVIILPASNAWKGKHVIC